MENIQELRRQTAAVAKEILSAAKLRTGQILVVGCSTSEVQGQKIGSAGSEEVAKAIFGTVKDACEQHNVHLAVQCCEHLNRALVVERQVMEQYHLEQVTVIPVRKAGGALAATAMLDFSDPVVVEKIAAHAGLDIGGTLIGMHLKHVAVPFRLNQKHIGQAFVAAALTRPKLIGGARAVYQ